MLLAQGQIYAKNMDFNFPIGFVGFARYCDKIYSCHLFPYYGFFLQLVRQQITRALRGKLQNTFYRLELISQRCKK